MNDPRHPRPRRAVTRLAASRVIFVVLASATLAGCGVRLETPPPAEPSPDAVEQVRARTVDDAVQLQADATALLAAGPPEAVQVVLTDVVTFSTAHAEQLGGEYVSGLPTPTPTSTSMPSAPPAPTVGTLLADLAATEQVAADDADAVTEGDLARLVASVAVARSELAARLSAATSLPLPQEPVDDATPAPTPTTGPDGPTVADLDALALVHDQAGFGLEVVAAKLSGDQRSAAQASAAQHRAESDDWARASGSAGTAQDPRRAAYTLPTGMDDPAVAQGTARSLESSVADTYATVVARVPAGARAPYVDGLRRATVAARAWGATPVAFPGLPERAVPAPPA